MTENPSGEGRLQVVSRRMLILIPFIAIAFIAPSACHRFKAGSASTYDSSSHESGWESSFHESTSSSNDLEDGDVEYHEQLESRDTEYWEDREKHD